MFVLKIKRKSTIKRKRDCVESRPKKNGEDKRSHASRIRAAIDCNNVRSRPHGREKEILKNFQTVTISVF